MPDNGEVQPMVSGMLSFSDTIQYSVAVYFSWSDTTKKLKMLYTQHSAHMGGRAEVVDNIATGRDAVNTVITHFCEYALPSGCKNKIVMQNTLTLTPLQWITPAGVDSERLKGMSYGINLLNTFCEGMSSLGLPASYCYRST